MTTRQVLSCREADSLRHPLECAGAPNPAITLSVNERRQKPLLADIPQSTKEVPRCRIVARYVEEQTTSVGANLGVITVLVRRPEPPNRPAQAVIILPGTQFSPTRQVPLAEVHAPSDRLSRTNGRTMRWSSRMQTMRPADRASEK
jgi:hypothetical protein